MQGAFAAAAWALGLYGLAGATFFMGMQMAGCRMSQDALQLLSIAFGVLPVLAAAFAYRAADTLATLLLGTWGALLLVISVVTMLAVVDDSMGSVDGLRAFGFPFLVLAAITWFTVTSAITRSAALAVVCVFLALSSTVAAIAYFVSSPNVTIAAGWLFELAAGSASYMASAILLNRTAGRVMLPLD